MVVPHPGDPGRPSGHYEPACEESSLNGSRATGSAQVRPVSRKMPRWSAERRAPHVTGRETPRHGVFGVPRHGTSRCGDPHQRLSALRPLLFRGEAQIEASTVVAKAARGKRSVGCLTSEIVCPGLVPGADRAAESAYARRFCSVVTADPGPGSPAGGASSRASVSGGGACRPAKCGGGSRGPAYGAAAMDDVAAVRDTDRATVRYRLLAFTSVRARRRSAMRLSEKIVRKMKAEGTREHLGSTLRS